MPPAPTTNEHLPIHQTGGEVYPALLSRISWGAILAGAVCAMAIQLLLTIIGLAFGFSAVDPAQDQQPLEGLGTATGIWWAVCSIISLFIGGWVAARLAGMPRSVTGALHGATVWALVAILTAWFAVAGVSRAIGGATSALIEAGQAVGQSAQAVLPDSLPNANLSIQGLDALLPNVNLEQRLGILGSSERQQQVRRDVREEAREIVRRVVSQQQQAAATETVQQAAQDVVTSPGDAGQDIERLFDRLFAGSDAIFTQEDRKELLNVLQNRLDVSPQEAETLVKGWEQRLQAAANELQQTWQQAQQQATQLAQTASDTMASVSGWTAFAMLLGLAAAALGGIMGRPEDVGVFWSRWSGRETTD